MAIRYRGDNGPDVLTDGETLRCSVTMMDHNTDAEPRSTILRDGFGQPPARRPGFVFDQNPFAGQQKAEAYAAYEQSLCDAYKSPEQKLAEARASAGNSMTAAGRNNPDPYAQPFENGDDDEDEDDDDEDQADVIVRRETQTSHEGTHRTDVPDARTLRNDHKAKMALLYDQLDSELREQWRQG